MRTKQARALPTIRDDCALTGDSHTTSEGVQTLPLDGVLLHFSLSHFVYCAPAHAIRECNSPRRRYMACAGEKASSPAAKEVTVLPRACKAEQRTSGLGRSELECTSNLVLHLFKLRHH